MASEPSNNIIGHQIPLAPSSEPDAEGEYEDELNYDMHQAMAAAKREREAPAEDPLGSDADAEGESDEDAEGEDDEPIAAIDFAANNAEDDGDVDAVVDTASEASVVPESEDDASDASSTEAENEWEGESDTAEEVGADISERNNCIFCNQDEENDPSEEFEEYLACAVCGDNAHRQCARDANTLNPESSAEQWRCRTCVENGLEADANKDADGSRSRRQSSTAAPKVAKELLPGHRGMLKPNSHSVFNTLILDDDPMDGSRSLRKRKSTEEAEINPRLTRKRRRPSEAASVSAGAARSMSAASSPKATRDGASEEPVVNGHPAVEEDEDDSPRRPGRGSRRNRKVHKGPCHIVSSEGISLIVSFNLDQTKLQKILSQRPRKNRARDRNRKKILPPPMIEQEISHYPGIDAGFTRQLFAMAEREQDDPKAKPYGGILTEVEANTEKTFPQEADRKRFEDARLKAEEGWKKLQAEINAKLETSRGPPKSSGPPSKIKCISFGGYEIDTWNAAPYPEEYSRNRLLYICEFCLKYMNSDFVAWRHKLKCPCKHPPGDEIYRDGKYSFFEVDGRKNPVYCQNLCLLAKLFLGSKTLYYDVEPFLFYVMTENDEFGCHFVGYFSKEKRPSSLNNVSCILVLPIYQRRGFGHMLIDFSYLLTKTEQKMGSPEKPLSDMGLVSYRGYWRLTLCELLRSQNSVPTTITAISERTGMTPDDIISALEGLRGLVRDPVTKTYAFRVDHHYCNEYIEKHEKKNYPRIKPYKLIWTPYVMNRGLTQHYEEGPTLHTVAPREDDVDEGASKSPAEDALDDAAAKSGVETRVNDISPRATKSRSPSHPSTPQPSNGTWNVTSHPTSIIPPSRFEVFPPIPGLTGKRRPGRPFGSRTRTRVSSSISTAMAAAVNATPSRREIHRDLAHNGSSPIGAGVLRRTRSMLGEEVFNGIDSMDGKDEDGDEVMGDAEEEEEEEEEQEEKFDEDADAEGEEDEDAEGEDE